MLTSIQQSGLPHTDYYAPRFRVEIDGKELSPQTNGDVLSISVKMDMENITSFDMTITNLEDHLNERLAGDERTARFKYSDSPTFNVGRQVHIEMGYADRLVPMMTGQITSMAPKFPQQGASTITVGGMDGMFRLKNRQVDKDEETKYTNKTDWQIAQIIAERNNLQANVTREGPTHLEVVQKNQDDAQFLKERAARIDFDCFVLTDPETAETKLHFTRPTDGRDNSRVRNFSFHWGQDLISFTPTINVTDQVGQVTVRGWDPATKEPIIATFGVDDLPQGSGGGPSGPQASQQSQEKNAVTVKKPVTSHQEALELARSLLMERAYNYLTATGQIIGQPQLRPGDTLTLKGLGSRFDGDDYYVKKVDHTIDASGYKTQFEVRRLNEGKVTETPS